MSLQIRRRFRRTLSIALPLAGVSVFASPASAQATRSWITPGFGFFDEAQHWTGNAVPGVDDTAEFNLNDNVFVQFDDLTGDRANAGLNVLNGNNVFLRDSGAARTYSAQAATISAGILGFTDMAFAPAGAVAINNGGALRLNIGSSLSGGEASSISLGTSGNASLNTVRVASGADAAANNVTIGAAAGTAGIVTVIDAGSSLTLSGALTVGVVGTGTLEISNGANVNADSLTIGSHGALKVDLANAGAPLVVGSLSLGGKLDLTAASVPATLGTTRIVLDAQSAGGHFATIDGVSIGASRSLAVRYAADGLVTATVAISGDTNLADGVNFADLVTVAQNYNGADTTWTQGDFTGDGKTNFSDLVVLAQNYNRTSIQDPASLSASFAADWAVAQSLVPEPTLCLLIVPAARLLGRRRTASPF